MDAKTLAVIGAGNGGFAMAADLTFAGWNINLYELPRFKENIEPLLGKKEIEITGAANNGFAKLARIEHVKGEFTLYAEGFTPSMMKILDALDRELVHVKRALGLPPMSFKEQVEIRYEKPFEEWFNFLRTIGNRGPFNAKARYITEDVPIGMVLIASLGRWLQVPTPTYDATIHLAEIINDTDYWAMGRSLENLGLSDFTVQNLQHFLSEASMASGK